MSAKLGVDHGGAGGAPSSEPTGAGLTEEKFATIQGMDAKEAVMSLDGDFAEGKLPDLETVTFPGPISEAMYWSNAQILGIQGPVGSGKTTTLLKSRARRAVEMPRSVVSETRHGITGHWRLYKLVVVRETYRQLWSTTIPSYLEVYPRELGTWSGGRGDPVTHVIVFQDANGPIEFRVEFMAFGDTVLASMRGIQATDIWINETDTVPVEVLTAGIGRINRWPGRHHFEGYPPRHRSYGQIAGDFNAPDEENWTFSVFHDEAGQREMEDLMNAQVRAAAEEQGVDPDQMPIVSIAFFNQPGYGEVGCENLQNLSADYYAVQLAANKLAGRGDMNDRLVYNKITYLRAGEPVFKREFNPRTHVGEEPLELIQGVPLRVGLDQGYKGAAVVGQFVTPFHWRIYAELHFPKERLMAREFGRRLADLLDRRFPEHPIEAGWGDMAGEQGSSLAAEENATWNALVSQAAGFKIRAQRVGTNRIQPRLEAVRAPLEFIEGGEPGLLIDPSCKFLRAGFTARYVWTDQVDKSGDKRKVPDKSLTEANVMDALQYLLLSEHRFDGTSPISHGTKAGGFDRRHPGSGRRGAPPLAPLTAGFDITDPYGSQH